LFGTWPLADLATGADPEILPGTKGSATPLNDPVKIVLVEDEAFQRQVVTEFLGKNGLRIIALASGAEFKRTAEKSMPDLAILDVHLGESEDGVSLARWLRARSSRVGIIMLTAVSDPVDRVIGLESGADDYIPKPFDPRELLARVRAVLRRAAEGAAPPSQLPQQRVGTAMLDLERRVLILADGQEDPLTASEFDLLRLLVENANRPLSRDWLLEATSHREADVFDRAIDNRIMRLRRKVETDPGKPEAIRSVRGVGYMFVPPRG
jgi:DNA-binding response OmpR family regulator